MFITMPNDLHKRGVIGQFLPVNQSTVLKVLLKFRGNVTIYFKKSRAVVLLASNQNLVCPFT